MAEYNRTTRPQDYDPNDNAAPYYQKAFDAFVDMPDELRKPFVDWPADFNDAEQAILEQWLTSNTLAFEYFRKAVNKPYYWIKRRSEKDNYISNMTTPDLAHLCKSAEALGWDAKLNAVKGRFQSAFEDILDCYRIGNHKCRPNVLLGEQDTGLRVKQNAVHGAMSILDKSKVESEALRFFQNAIQTELDRDTYIPGCGTEKLCLYDTLQRTFVDNGKGTGRLWWRIGFDVIVPVAFESKSYERKIRLSCFIGPTRKQVVEQIEQTAALFNLVVRKTPWQIKNETRVYFREIRNINKRHISLKILDISIDPNGIFHSYHQTRAQTEALAAILASLRHKIDTGQFPETLNELVSSGYLQAVPNDPYSNSSLVYKLTEDGFKLYSVGEDFSDDGGTIEVVNEAMQMPGFGKTGIAARVHSPDIVYWPVRDLERLRYEFTFKEAERLRAEKD